MNLRLLSTSVALCTILTFAAPMATFAQEEGDAAAQAAEANAALEQSMKRIENRLIALERMVLGESKVSGSTMLADHEGRLQALEVESSKVYGVAEEVGNAVEVLAKKVDLIASDIDLRLTDIENAIQGGASLNRSSSAATIPTGGKRAEPQGETVPVPANIDSEELYKEAYGYMKKGSFPTAQAWFDAYTKRFPKEDKAQNAYYWLGEVYLVQQDPQSALVAFGQAVKGFPTGERTPDALLKMGVAFQDIGKDNLAKTTWEKLTRDFPDSGAAASAKKRLEGLN